MTVSIKRNKINPTKNHSLHNLTDKFLIFLYKYLLLSVLFSKWYIFFFFLSLNVFWQSNEKRLNHIIQTKYKNVPIKRESRKYKQKRKTKCFSFLLIFSTFWAGAKQPNISSNMPFLWCWMKWFALLQNFE